MQEFALMCRYDLPGECYLRLLEGSDAEDLVRVIDANREYLAEWLPWVETQSNSVNVRREFIRRTRQQLADDDGFQAAIVEGDEIIGVVGFHGVDWKNRATSIGYWLAENRQGQGTMTEAVRALTMHAFRIWKNLNRVEIRVATGNQRSAAIPRRLGFSEEGVLREAERHGTPSRTSPSTRCSCRIGRRGPGKAPDRSGAVVVLSAHENEIRTHGSV